MYKTVPLFLSAVFLFIASVRGQNDIAFKHLTINDGLSNGSVTCILQDRQGFMWFGTQDGLNRYDGYNFKIFKNIPSDSTSLSDNFIFSILEDKSGTLYIETQSKKFNKYNPESESFTIVSKQSINFQGAKVNTVDAVLYESDVVWTGGAGRGTGLEKLDLKSGKAIYFRQNSSNPSSLIDDKVYSVYRDHSGNLWVGTKSGLDRLDERTGKFFHYKNDPNNPNSLPDNWVWPIFEDSHGYIWLGTVRGGLSRFDCRTNKFTNFKNDPSDPRSLSNNWIFSIYEDRSGVIWVGTNTGGINYFNPSMQVFDHYLHDPKNKNSLSDNNVLAMEVDSKGNYWIGTAEGGLDKYIPSKNMFYNYSQLSSNKLITNSIMMLYEDKLGKLWMGTLQSGLLEFDPSSGNYEVYKNDPENINTISDNRVFSVIEDSDGSIWIGTYGGGLNRLDRKTGKITRYQHSDQDSSSISSNSVWSLIQSNTGELWIGTFGAGLDVFDKNQNIFKHFRHDSGNSSSLIDDNVMRVFQDSKNNIWIGTTKGLSLYDKKTNSFKNYNEENGLSNNFIFGILEDNKGNLWISTNNGLSEFNPENESFKNYYYEDGLQGNEFNQNAFAKDSKTGKLLFGGPNGFNVFNPDSLKENNYVPPIVFTNYLRFNTDDEEGKPIIEKGISERNNISLTYKDNIVTFEFSALNFINNYENQYRYKLVGFNENWIQLGNTHRVTFTNLSQGDYVLKVIGSNNDDVWNDEGASLNIHVSPPWWKTNIAYGIYFIAFFAFLYGVRKFELDRREKKAQIRESALRIKATEAEKRALEIENERKTKELEEARQLQLSMLPKKLPELTNIEIAAFMRTATEVGGDYYDFRQDNGSLYVAFGDATGHGLQAGTMVTLMKGFFTSDSSKLGMQEFMNHCSKMIKEIELGRILMSFSYLKIENNKLLITSAGMPPIYYYNSIDKQVEEIIIQGMPLGAMKNFPYKVIEREINSGDTLLLLTDGLPEQMNAGEEMFDYTRVKAKFSDFNKFDSQQIIDKLVVEGDNWMNGTLQADDITFVVIKFK